MSILVVVAHPDDEVLGCGGTIAEMARQGAEVNIAILGEGAAARAGAQESQIIALRATATRVASTLGARNLHIDSLPDNRFDAMPLLDVVKIVEGLIERFRPRTVLTHWEGDLNIDHAITYRAVLTATRPIENCSVKELYAFEVPSSTEWAFGHAFSPDTYIDISSTLAAKILAMQMYESESRACPHPRSPESLRALAQWRGSTVGLRAAEAFQTIRRLL